RFGKVRHEGEIVATRRFGGPHGPDELVVDGREVAVEAEGERSRRVEVGGVESSRQPGDASRNGRSGLGIARGFGRRYAVVVVIIVIVVVAAANECGGSETQGGG